MFCNLTLSILHIYEAYYVIDVLSLQQSLMGVFFAYVYSISLYVCVCVYECSVPGRLFWPASNSSLNNGAAHNYTLPCIQEQMAHTESEMVLSVKLSSYCILLPYACMFSPDTQIMICLLNESPIDGDEDSCNNDILLACGMRQELFQDICEAFLCGVVSPSICSPSYPFGFCVSQRISCKAGLMQARRVT